MLCRGVKIIAYFSSILFEFVEIQFDVAEIIHALYLQELFLKYFIADDLLTRLECVPHNEEGVEYFQRIVCTLLRLLALSSSIYDMNKVEFIASQ
jgi:hypothetical protein